ncbi:MAG TPA: diadenosine tetraphosphate hydrolase [Dehalococcoidia bacterium]|nr:diadenosine tetraphosphate hydrolase [Dehalococcoidia bacterium]
MKHASYDDACGICKMVADGTPLYENGLWAVHRLPDGIGVPGWLMLLSRRHVAGPAHFNDAEAESFGPTLRHLERVLEDVTGALRIYTAAMGESFPHFHGHMVPRQETMPNDASAWSVFDLYRATQEGEIAIDQAEATRIAEAYSERLRSDPPPHF